MNQIEYELELIGLEPKSLWMNLKENPKFNGDKDAISAWLMDVVKDYAFTLDEIDAVLNGEKEEDLIWGNSHKAIVKADVTEIHFNYEDEAPSVKPCSLPTSMLREIVEIWLREYKKFKEERHKN